MKHKHSWQLVQKSVIMDYKSIGYVPISHTITSAEFVCDCGEIKKVKFSGRNI